MPRNSKKKEIDPLDSVPSSEASEDGKSNRGKADEPPSGPFVTVLKSATAGKLSPRGDGEIIYMVGVLDGKAYVRIADNNSGGRHSKEWLPVDAIRKAFTKSMLACNTFKSNSFAEAFKSQSNNNSGFLVAILRKEGLFVADEKKPHLTRLASSEALDVWEKNILNMPKPHDAERVPLNPSKPKHLFKRKGGANAPLKTSAPSVGDAV